MLLWNRGYINWNLNPESFLLLIKLGLSIWILEWIVFNFHIFKRNINKVFVLNRQYNLFIIDLKSISFSYIFHSGHFKLHCKRVRKCSFLGRSYSFNKLWVISQVSINRCEFGCLDSFLKILDQWLFIILKILLFLFFRILILLFIFIFLCVILLFLFI